ncbi:MAG: OmpA family protein, partial [Bacteroidota bacterium]
MKRFFLFAILMGLGLLAAAQSNDLNTYNALSARVLAIDLELVNQEQLTTSTTFGLEIAYRRQLSKRFGIALPLKLGTIDVGELNNRSIVGLEILPTYFPFGTETKISPYLHAGYGFVAEDFETSNNQIPLGGGINFKIGGNSWFGLQGEYRMSDRDLRDNVMVGLGYTYRLSSIDTDGDGVANRDDQCPSEPGPAASNGCPDADMDGVLDANDKCPNLAGSANLAGCPDTDLDGVADPDDKCPDLAGLAALSGCPDGDEDGVADPDDQCPEAAGLPENDGCPDIDGDGIIDSEDTCPEQAGLATLSGCPDADGDGVSDAEDQCPNQKGVAPTGCPDQDGDGTPDKDDPCPAAAGDFGGCPDTDGDGLADDKDRCPTQAGTAANSGCPEIEEEVRKTLDYAARAVQFETGSAKLKDVSYVTLGEIAGIMREYRDYDLVISGHTDNVGLDENNLTLSRRRASACRDYLVATGIEANRISTAGYGAGRPKATNTTAAGRRENRRVEFELAPHQYKSRPPRQAAGKTVNRETFKGLL